MIKNLPLFRKKRKQVLTIFWLVFLLFLTIFLVFSVVNYYQKPEIKWLTIPEKELLINEPFSGNLYFNDTLGYNTFSPLVVSGIERAEKSIELAMYSFDSLVIRDALIRAADRGVAVKIIFSSKHEVGENNFFSEAQDKIQLKFLDQKKGYMHHKFMIVDGGQPSQELFFGSYNFTEIQDKFDPSFLMITKRPEIVSLFGEEFDRLDNEDSWLSKKTLSYNPFKARIIYPEGFLEIWFLPENNNYSLKSKMISLIKEAKNSLQIMIWLLTDNDLASAFLYQAKKIPVSIITDDFNWSAKGSFFPIMEKQKQRQEITNLQFVTDEKRNQEVLKFFPDSDLNSFLHHHTLIIDDDLVIFGTNNWSGGGFLRNDESVMISNLDNLVLAFKNSYNNNLKANK